jgi:hypothetical protein
VAISSTVPTIKDALVTALKAQAGLAGIQVERAHPGPEKLDREAVWLGAARGRHVIPVMKAGRKSRDEEYIVEVLLSVVKPGGTLEEAEERAFALLAEVEDVLADDPRLGTTAILWAKAGEWGESSGYLDEGAEADIRLEVECKARLD